ncbi:LPS-assembly protein LptD [Puteibacter caeruleilacunae]|nr:LPS-assembly protein LptD [Puteibacter caeruleilacunae]
MRNDSLRVDSLAVQPSDSLNIEAKTDSIKKPMLESEITYSAVDSFVLSRDNKRVYLYKGAKINYQSIELTADYIELDMENKEVYAEGLPNDTSGIVEGTPVFKDGDEEFKAQKMRYNFETKKAIVTDIRTEQNGGFVHSKTAKKTDEDEYCMVTGKYTTCDHDHPHYYLHLTKAKVIANKKIITGPAYMVLEDFPLYFPTLPFGYFPNSKKYSSGILIPSYGEENQRGFFLRDGGYYWAANDYFDAAIRGEIYSKGSWGLKFNTNYKLRYRFKGNFDFKYFRNVFEPTNAEEIIAGKKVRKDFSIRWSHSQDAKANPSSTFSASVNFSTSTYDKNNSYNPSNYLTNSKSSSISYSKRWENSPFSMSANLRHSQNAVDTTISLTLPEMTLTMGKIYPFKRKNRVGKAKFYEKFGLSYSGNYRNSVPSVKESEIWGSDKWQNGARHNTSLTLPQFKLLKFFNFTPSISYQERWYTDYITKEWRAEAPYYDPITEQTETQKGELVNTKHYGFKRAYEYSYGLSATTQIYGFFTFKEGSRVQAIRHVMKPSISFSYRPDFSDDKYGFYRTVLNEETNEMVRYSIFEKGIFGSPGAGESGAISFSLNNNVEMKMLNRGDSITEDTKYKKIKLLDNLNISTSYNLVADSFKLSNINFSGRTKIRDININFSGIFDPYALESYTTEQGQTMYRKVDKYEWKENHKIGRLTSASLSFGLSFKSKKEEKEKTKEEEEAIAEAEEELERKAIMQDAIPGYNTAYTGYADFSVPWDLNLDYSFRYSRALPTNKSRITQSVDFRGNLSLTPKWKVGFTSGYDIEAGELSYTNFTIRRDLHCWQMSFNVTPFGARRSYMFTINVNSSLLGDLKLDKNKSFRDNF